jgi:Nucleotide modification associated domain 3
MAAFLANVGVNAGHAATSPLNGDGSFQLIPIPEPLPWRPPMLRFADLATSTVPAGWTDRAAHLDPDLAAATPTYGDNCRTAGRAYSLRRAEPGDLIAFVARLEDPAGKATFQLVGCLDIEDVLADVTRDPGAGWWDGNAHMRRARAHGVWNSFWVFRGSSATRVFHRAVPFGRDAATEVFGDGWLWRASRTELQTIGSYTRAVRRVEGRGEAWLRTTCLS